MREALGPQRSAEDEAAQADRGVPSRASPVLGVPICRDAVNAIPAVAIDAGGEGSAMPFRVP